MEVMTTYFFSVWISVLMSSLMLLLLLLLAMDSSVMELAADTADLSKQILAETSALNE